MEKEILKCVADNASRITRIADDLAKNGHNYTDPYIDYRISEMSSATDEIKKQLKKM